MSPVFDKFCNLIGLRVNNRVKSIQTANINSPLTCWQPQQRKLLGEDDMQAIPVYQVDSFKVVHGANLSDTMSFADELMLDDVYTLKKFRRAASCLWS
jgi:hypothetical protein